MENEIIIDIRDLHRNFKVGSEIVHALNGVSFSIREGEFVSIMGTSGSGKSTLLNILGCLDTPSSGDYILSQQEPIIDVAQPHDRVCVPELQPAGAHHRAR